MQASSVFAPSLLLSLSAPQDREMSPPADLGIHLGSGEHARGCGTAGGLMADKNRVGAVVLLQLPGVPLVILYMHSHSAAPRGPLVRFSLYLSSVFDC